MEIRCLPTDAFPECLAAISSPPDCLYALGNTSLLRKDMLAIVGTRRASAYGLRSAALYARNLVHSGYVIVSGLARGIDTMAHSAALKAGGETIAVLGHGLDRVYPAENSQLAYDILNAGGCLLSEYPVGAVPLPHHFPERNRIISGLSLGVLVIEASEKSGSLITARSALDQGRELFVLASHFDQNSFKGSHRLLQSGAKLVTCVEDILEELPSPRNEKGGASRKMRTPDAFPSKLLSKIWPIVENGRELVSLGEILSASSLPLADVLPIIKIGIESGEIAEIYPQHFIRVADGVERVSEKEELPN